MLFMNNCWQKEQRAIVHQIRGPAKPRLTLLDTKFRGRCLVLKSAHRLLKKRFINILGQKTRYCVFLVSDISCPTMVPDLNLQSPAKSCRGFAGPFVGIDVRMTGHAISSQGFLLTVPIFRVDFYGNAPYGVSVINRSGPISLS